MSSDNLELTLAASAIKGNIPKDGPLADRVLAAMKCVRSHEHDIFWMCHSVNDDLRIRAALAGVLVEGNEQDRDVITRSLRPLRMLAAATQGIPVDFSQMETSDDLVPIIKLWHESGEKSNV